MKWYRNLVQTDAGPFIYPHPVFGGGANINEGSVVVRGPTGGTNTGYLVNPANTSTNLTGTIGVLAVQDTNSVSGADTNKIGTNYTTQKVICNPDAVYLAEYSQAASDLVSVVSSGGATVTITSLETSFDGAWLYAVSGTGAGRLTFVLTSAAGSCTTKEATGWDATTKVIKILPRFHKTLFFNSTFDKLASQAAAGVTGAFHWAQMIETDTIPVQELNPTLHSGVVLGLPMVVHFYSQIVFTTYAAYNG